MAKFRVSGENDILRSPRLTELTMQDYERRVEGLRQVLLYFENAAKEAPIFAPEVERTRLIIAAAERRNGEELRELLARPMPDHYGGTGWHYVVAMAKLLAEDFEKTGRSQVA
jgi:hypothetical protein